MVVVIFFFARLRGSRPSSGLLHSDNHCFNIQHFKQLLASTYPEILVATLETLSALVKINPSKLHVSGKLIECGSINNYLLSLAQGCGSKEEGLGLYSCVVTNERNQNDGLCLFLKTWEMKTMEPITDLVQHLFMNSVDLLPGMTVNWVTEAGPTFKSYTFQICIFKQRMINLF